MCKRHLLYFRFHDSCELSGVGLLGSHKLHACRLASRKIPSDSLELITRSWKDKVR